jgi:hypothetical protein
MTGIMLGYLINNFLIDRHQYEQWRKLSFEELREELETADIMNSSEFNVFSQQLIASAEVYTAQGEDGF